MESLSTILRLGLGGLLLDPRAFQAQRDAPDGLRRGLLLVALVGLLVGLAGWVGDIGEALTTPDPEAFSETLYRGLTGLPLYRQLVEELPELAAAVDQALAQPQAGLLGPSPLLGAVGLLTTPLLHLLGWLLFGALVHLAARAFGGAASFGQTLACTALASGAGLLALVQVVPYAQVAATTLLGLIATYVAVREAHGLRPGRALLAVALGPLLLAVVGGGLLCCVLFLFIGALGGAAQGAGL
ncbi:MAG TPA: Yip1 family protein [Chloroflexaceae bacterium]|nr:Yip1 family protein [Chloroflexaceae bacterium]